MHADRTINGIEINPRFIPVDSFRLSHELHMLDMVVLNLGIGMQIICAGFALLATVAIFTDIPAKVIEIFSSLVFIAISVFTYNNVRLIRQRIDAIRHSTGINPALDRIIRGQ